MGCWVSEWRGLVRLGGDAVVFVVDLPFMQRVGEGFALRRELAHLAMVSSK